MSDTGNVKGRFEPRAISELKGSFVVQKYQRGYKWGPREVLALLNDIDEFDLNRQGGTFYCLQPTVVMVKEGDVYELIDGQQRISTIFIILSALPEGKPHFAIDYETRTGSAEFLQKIREVPEIGLSEQVLTNNDYQKLGEEIRPGWNSFITNTEFDPKGEANNIDNFHFYQAWQIVRNWLGREGLDREAFRTKLLHHAKVIWYEVESSIAPEKVFMNLNSGKIDLTGSELIKALFVLQIQQEANADIRQFRQNELAQEWDLIESTLQKDNFWHFLVGDKKGQYMTRIDFLFDLLKGKPAGETDRLWAYYEYDKLRKQKQDMDWEEVNMLFQKLRDWYEDVKLYHRIGFLINTKIVGLDKIWSDSKELGKVEFFNSLDERIKKRMEKSRKDSRIFYIDNLNYESDRHAVQMTLLLFNIISLEKSDPGYRFPFGEYPMNESSVEHIHPQNPKGVKTVGEAKDWLVDFRERAAAESKAKGRDDEENYTLLLKRIGELEKKLVGASDSDSLSRELAEDFATLGDELVNSFDLHKISNLALLSKRINSKIGNRKFLEKRRILLKIDQDRYPKDNENKMEVPYGFIPPGTRNAFLKYYSRDTESIQMRFWSSSDADSYQKAIQAMLKDYLPATSKAN